MKWFIVVVMMSHTNLSGVEETPLFIGFKDFPDRATCIAHAMENQHTYFAKAISGSTAPNPAKVPNPQSEPAITRSTPTILVKRFKR